ncbi:MAG: hypothetical protein ACRENX_00015 [Candidatus Dormibacteria bacterium]
MDALLVIVGGLIGGGFGLAGAWVGARAALRSTRISEQRALLASRRDRLLSLDAPVLDFVNALESIVMDQAFLWGDDTVEAKRARHRRFLEERQAQMDQVASRIALEPGTEELEHDLREIWQTFGLHMRALRTIPQVPYSPDDQTASIDKIQSLNKKIEADLKEKVAALDRRAEEVVGLRLRARSRFPGRRRS